MASRASAITRKALTEIIKAATVEELEAMIATCPDSDGLTDEQMKRIAELPDFDLEQLTRGIVTAAAERIIEGT